MSSPSADCPRGDAASDASGEGTIRDIIDMLDPTVTPSATLEHRYEALAVLCGATSDEASAEDTIAALIAADGVPVVVRMLDMGEDWRLVHDAAWVALNISSSADPASCAALMAAGAAPRLVALLEHPSTGAVEKCAWAIGNMIGESLKVRDEFVALGAVDGIRKVLATSTNLTPEGTDTMKWALSGLLRKA